MKTQWQDLASGDLVRMTPGKMSARNDEDEDVVELTPLNLTMSNAAGDSMELLPTGLTFTSADDASITINAEGITITKDGKTTSLTLLQLLHQDGSHTMTITEDEIAIVEGSNNGLLKANVLTLGDGAGSASLEASEGMNVSDGTNTAQLSPALMQIIRGADTVTVSPQDGLSAQFESKTIDLNPTDGLVHADGDDTMTITAADGLSHQASSQSAELSASAGLQLAASTGTVDLAAVAGKSVSLRSTEVCDIIEGVPTTLVMIILRSDD